MGVTSITRIENHSSSSITLINREVPDSTARLGWLSPGQRATVDVHVPWAPNSGDFPVHHLEVHVDGQSRFWIWQAARPDGDYVRVSADGRWHDPGEHTHGVAAVDGNRTLVVRDGCIELTDFPVDLLAGLRDVVSTLGYRLCEQQPVDPDRTTIASVPKRAATAFSMAGIASDSFRSGNGNARFLYRDEGKRYDFEIADGIVTAIHPDGTRTPLTAAISYERRRAGERSTAPPFDLIAANGGRVIAKARGVDRFYFTTMDEMFVRESDGGSRTVPSTFFKLDPECSQPTARTTDLTRHLDGCFGEHPAAERFPLFRLLLEQNLVDLMVVALEPRVWHLIDGRTPVGAPGLEVMGIELVRRMLAAADGLPSVPGLNEIKEALATYRALLEMRQRRLQESGPTQSAPPGGMPTYPHVSFCRDASTITLPSIDFRKVLDVGIGHVHWHEQYARVTGGELQPLRTGRILPEPLPPIGYAELYRAVNGPIRDGDGYIDGTCNFYLLVELRGGGYALLYLDEQMYFTQRWRLCSPEDFGGGGLALVVALNEDPTRDPPLYNWREDTYWDPFRSGHIGPQSRLAVSRQVLLVTGEDPGSHEARIYSINFSHGTMDRTWRWRALPAPALTYDPVASNGADPSVPRDRGDCVFPQTIRLREDMTLHLMGARRLPDGSVEPGRWYQRYLPANNQLVPPAAALVADAQPREGYNHHWKFLPEATFRRADRFSHLGVHDAVDSRTQYYPLAQPSAAVEQVLASASGPWIDVDRQLFVRAWKFWWAAPLRPPAVDVDVLKGYLGPPAKRPPSIFNPDTMLRIVKRGSRWVAMHWDKRDDDLMPFEDLPKTVRLRNGDRTVEVTLEANVFLESPPAVRRAHFWWEESGEAAVAFTAPQVSSSAARDNVWRVRMAALEPDAADPTRIGRVAWLLDVEREGRFTLDAEGYHRYRWAPTAAERAALTTYCSPAGEARYATSIWFEDTVGHVAVPEAVRWSPPPVMHVAASPSTVPLGVPARMTVSATDAHTTGSVTGTVLVDGNPVASTGASFTHTFTTHTEREFDPERRVWISTIVEPVVTVTAPDYRETSVGLDFYYPELRLQAEPASIPIGQPVSLTVRATDATTGAPVAGRVSIGGQDAGGTNAPFTYTFAAGQTSGTVTAAGYPSRNVAFALYQPVSNAAFVAQSVPTVMVTGERYNVWVRMRNTGTTTWAPGGSTPFRLGSQNPQDNSTWGTNRVALTAPVAPGGEATFAFTVTAPSSPGTWRFQWRMVHELVQWFGGWSPDTGVQVSPPTVQATSSPYPVPLNQSVQVTIRAVRNPGGAPVAGDVLVNGTRVAATNTPFTYTFRLRIVSRTFDPETRRYINEYGPPDVVVRAAGYADAGVDLGL